MNTQAIELETQIKRDRKILKAYKDNVFKKESDIYEANIKLEQLKRRMIRMKKEIYNLEYVKSIDELFILLSEIGRENISEDDFKNINYFSKGYLLAEQNDDINILYTFEDYITYYFKRLSHK